MKLQSHKHGQLTMLWTCHPVLVLAKGQPHWHARTKMPLTRHPVLVRERAQLSKQQTRPQLATRPRLAPVVVAQPPPATTRLRPRTTAMDMSTTQRQARLLRRPQHPNLGRSQQTQVVSLSSRWLTSLPRLVVKPVVPTNHLPSTTVLFATPSVLSLAVVPQAIAMAGRNIRTAM